LPIGAAAWRQSGPHAASPGGKAANVATISRAAGRTHHSRDVAGCSDKAGLLARTADALEFPAWFGHNWDALADCLTDLAWRPAPDPADSAD
jgi:hypothetical protein